MSDIEKFISRRKARTPKAWAGFEDKYRDHTIGMMLADYRMKSGMTLEEFATKTKMKKAALSRLETHGEDVCLSTIARYVEAVGHPLGLRFFPGGKRKSKAVYSLLIEVGRG